MPILTKPTSITKGIPASVSLDKDLLKALPSIDSDVYWKDTTNWKTIIVSFKNFEGQLKSLIMDASNPVGIFLSTGRARSEFKIQSIVIKDFDYSRIKIKRSELTAQAQDPDFDFDYTIAPPPLGDDDFFETEDGFTLVTENDELIAIDA